MKPQLCVDCQDPESLFRSDEWVAEEKLDGDRLIVSKRGNSVECWTREGNLRDCPQVVAVALTSEYDFTLDGELMPGGEFVVFGEPSGAPNCIQYTMGLLFGFRLVRRADGEENKRALWALIEDEGGEGIVFKRWNAPYREGQRTDEWQRLKFYETEPFTVGAVNLAKSSFEVWKDGKCYGSVACGMKRLPLTGETVRVRYDRITEKGKLLRAVLR